MAYYPNQDKIIIDLNDNNRLIHKKDELNADGTPKQFLKAVNWDVLEDILLVLSGNELKVYLYLLKWAGQGYYDYSPADIIKVLNIGESTSQKIKKKFIELGFLVPQSNRTYKFNPSPDKLHKQAVQKFGEIMMKKEGHAGM